MATTGRMTVETFEAGADLSAKQLYFVTLAADGQIDATGNGAAADGVLLNKPSAAGAAASVCVHGRTKVVAGGSVTVGDDVAADANGACVTATSSDVRLGVAMETAASGEVLTIDFFRGGNTA